MKDKITFKLANDSPLGRAGQSVTVDGGKVYVEGKRIDLILQPQDVHAPEEIPTYLSGYKPFGFRADEMSPPVQVDHDEDFFRDHSLSNAFRRVQVKASIDGAIPEVDPVTSTTKFRVVDRLLGSFINQVTEDNATGRYKPRQAAAKKIANAVALDREIDVVNLLTTPGNWASANVNALGAGYEWNGGVNSHPILNLQAAIVSSAQQVTDIWLNQLVAFDFLNHAETRDYIKAMLGDGAVNTTLGNVSNAQRAMVDFTIPGFPPFHVVGAKVLNESTGDLDFVMPNDVVLTTRPAGVPTDGEEIATSYTFRRRGGVGVGWDTREFRIEGRGPKGGTMLVVNQADIAIMTGKNVGALIRNARQ